MRYIIFSVCAATLVACTQSTAPSARTAPSSASVLPKGTLNIVATDSNGNGIGPATFRVSGPMGSDQLWTDNDPAIDVNPDPGWMNVDGLPLGTYTVCEFVPPPGTYLDPSQPSCRTVTLTTQKPYNHPFYFKNLSIAAQ